MRLFTESQARERERELIRRDFAFSNAMRDRVLERYPALPETPIEVPEEVLEKAWDCATDMINTLPWSLMHDAVRAVFRDRVTEVIRLLTQSEAEPSKEESAPATAGGSLTYGDIERWYKRICDSNAKASAPADPTDDEIVEQWCRIHGRPHTDTVQDIIATVRHFLSRAGASAGVAPVVEAAPTVPGTHAPRVLWLVEYYADKERVRAIYTEYDAASARRYHASDAGFPATLVPLELDPLPSTA